MNHDEQRAEKRAQINQSRQATYYLGMALMVIGILMFLSVFLSGAMAMNAPFGQEPNMLSFMGRAVGGMVLTAAGRGLMAVGARGLAGSGVVLDPDRARDDLKPWAQAGGGIVRDVLDEAGIGRERKPGESSLTFDEKLRRLEALRKDGVINDAEYQEKRAEIMREDW
jgi:hypothetical protein